jgi:hypothetical protein
MTILCERCKKEIFKNEVCNYCGRKICHDCVKASQKASKTQRLVICKDCWGKTEKKLKYKNKKSS